MVKFVAGAKDGGVIVGLGIVRDNVKALEVGNPIAVPLSKLQIPPGVEAENVTVFIFFEETMEIMANKMKEYIGPHTTVQGSWEPQ